MLRERNILTEPSGSRNVPPSGVTIARFFRARGVAEPVGTMLAPAVDHAETGSTCLFTWKTQTVTSLSLMAFRPVHLFQQVTRKPQCVRFQRRMPASLQADQNPDLAVVDSRTPCPYDVYPGREGCQYH